MTLRRPIKLFVPRFHTAKDVLPRIDVNTVVYLFDGSQTSLYKAFLSPATIHFGIDNILVR